MIYQANSNLCVKPINSEDAKYKVFRSHLNQKEGATYTIGDEFEYVYGDDSGLILKDSDGVNIFVPDGEQQCFDVK